MTRKMKKGVIYKGRFWPLYGGGILYNSDSFSFSISEDLSPTLRAEKYDAAVCVEYETEDSADRQDMEERG